jgi:hypothetical protein
MSRSWIKLHVEALDNPKFASLTMTERGIWLTALLVAERYDHDGALPPASRFALMAHYDAQQTEKAFAVLVRKGFLDERDGTFFVHDWETWQEVEWYNTREAWRDRKRLQRERARESQHVTRDTEGHVTRDIVTGRDMSQVTRIEKEKEKNGKEREREPYSSTFERFWEAYGRKGVKRAAYEQWLKVVGEADNSALMEAVPLYLATRRVREGYKLDAERWLKERAWENPTMGEENEPRSLNGKVVATARVARLTPGGVVDE